MTEDSPRDDADEWPGGDDDSGNDADDSTRDGADGWLKDDSSVPEDGSGAPADDPLDWPPSPAGETRADDPDATPDSGDDATDVRGDSSDAPLGDLAGDVRERRAQVSDRPDERLFEQQDVTAIDADVVWDRLEDDAETSPVDPDEREVREVEKQEYCEHCPFFSPPPDVQCTHEGTEIVELVDMEHFQVVDCPKVQENERLEEL